jgi:peptidyl-prolyl cis-trans isomerase D
MLDIFRKYATSWLIKVFFFLIVVVFIFWGGYSYRQGRDTEVARVDDQPISVSEYDRTYNRMMDMYRRQLGAALSPEMLEQFNVKRQALDMLIDQHVISRAAHELGVEATEQEVQQRILDFPAFQADGKFDRQRYLILLQQNRLTPEAFERQIGEEISKEKLEGFIKRRAIVTEDEIVADFRFTYQRVQLLYAVFDPKIYESQVAIDPAKAQAYYQEHQGSYQEPEKRQFTYVKLNVAEFLNTVNVSEDEIRQYYDENIEKYHQEQEIRARHILFSVKEDAPESEISKVRADAEKVLAEAKKGADFALLAGKHSTDEATAKNGGDLGYFGRDRMVQAFSDAAFSMKAGEISDLVRTPYGFHIIKVEDIKPENTKSFDQVKTEISETLKSEKARDMAFRKVTDFADLVYAQQDLAKAAVTLRREVVAPDGWLAQTDKFPGEEGVAPDFMSKLFALPDKGTSEVLEVSDGFVVVQVKAIQAQRPLPYESVKERVEKEYRTVEGVNLAQKVAAEILESARKSGNLDEAVKSSKVQVKKTDWLSRKQPDKDLKLRGDSLARVFRLQTDQPFPETPLTDVSNRMVVCQLLGRLDPDADLEKERQAISKRLLGQKESVAWRTWLDERKKLASIKILKEL